MRILRALGWTMIGSGMLILAFLAYQLFGTTVITARAQDQAIDALETRFAEVRADLSPTTTTSEVATVETLPDGSEEPGGTVVPAPELLEEPAPDEGQPLGRIAFPTLEKEYVLFEGVTRQTLKKGPGHMPWTPLPGQLGNAVISGHRTTYGAPFYDLDALAPGDRIVLETAIGTHVYEVRETIIVSPTDVWVTEFRPGAWLTLTTCNPRFSARERLIVFAEMVDGPNAAAAAAAKASLVQEAG